MAPNFKFKVESQTTRKYSFKGHNIVFISAEFIWSPFINVGIIYMYNNVFLIFRNPIKVYPVFVLFSENTALTFEEKQKMFVHMTWCSLIDSATIKLIDTFQKQSH